MRASITTMSLPDGRYNRRVLAACREGGYTQVYTPVPRAEHEPLGFTVGRLNVHGDSTPEWNQNVLQPGSRALSGLERQYQDQGSYEDGGGRLAVRKALGAFESKEPNSGDDGDYAE